MAWHLGVKRWRSIRLATSTNEQRLQQLAALEAQATSHLHDAMQAGSVGLISEDQEAAWLDCH